MVGVTKCLDFVGFDGSKFQCAEGTGQVENALGSSFDDIERENGARSRPRGVRRGAMIDGSGRLATVASKMKFVPR